MGMGNTFGPGKQAGDVFISPGGATLGITGDHYTAVRLATACFFLRYCCDTHHRRPKTFLWSPVMPRVAPPGEMKTSPACFPGPNVLPIPTATAPPNLPQPCCSAAQCNTLPPHAPSNPASNRPNPGRNPWIEVALGQIGPRGSRTASAGFQAPSTRIMSHLRHLTPSNTLPRSRA